MINKTKIIMEDKLNQVPKRKKKLKFEIIIFYHKINNFCIFSFFL